MESPRLRLLILGALRGLLRPGYAYGTNSIIREELLLRALSREIDGQMYVTRGTMDIPLIQAMASSARGGVYQKSVEMVNQGYALMRLQPSRECQHMLMNESTTKESKKAGAVLNLLKRTELYDRMAAVLSKH